MVTSTLTHRITRLRQRRSAPLILELDLTEGIVEEPAGDPVTAAFTKRRPRLADVLDGLRRAASDPRVRALVVKVAGRPIGLAVVQELRTAVAEFGAAGKLTIAWTETFGDFSPGNVPYYLATAFDRIYLQPSGDLGLTGISLQSLFYRGTLEKIGAEFQVAKRQEYKSAAERLTERAFSEPAREATQRVATSITEQISEAIAHRLEIPSAQARAMIDGGPYLASGALEAGLVDALGYRDHVYAAARAEAGPDAYLLFLGRYQRARVLAERTRTLPRPGADNVALIYATGPIRRGRSARGPLTSGAMGSDTVAGTLRTVTVDTKVKAIVLRVNSPGGSYVASDTIWREVVRAREAGKPVVVSMGDVAASGGYFIAMAADSIVAQPGTLTGSIGVLGGKPVVSGALQRAGVTVDGVREGAHADMFATTRPFTDDEWAKINAWLDRIYADFTGKVAAGRGLSPERVDEIARGRVWTGADAAMLGLVDTLGGLETALALARRKAGLAETVPVRLFPRSHPLDRIRPPESSDDRPAHAALLAESWGPVWRLAARAGLSPYGPLLLPGHWALH
ncbi:MAG TPA: signal peptide peptidase SppA [Streptosporangiaceae bacterium]|nr:signal peptide peptidase SppA [Streptosporangiaceae bacterium]